MLKIYQKRKFSPDYRLWPGWFDFLSFSGCFTRSSWVCASCWSGFVAFMFIDRVFTCQFVGLVRVLNAGGISGLSFRISGDLLVWGFFSSRWVRVLGFSWLSWSFRLRRSAFRVWPRWVSFIFIRFLWAFLLRFGEQCRLLHTVS